MENFNNDKTIKRIEPINSIVGIYEALPDDELRAEFMHLCSHFTASCAKERKYKEVLEYALVAIREHSCVMSESLEYVELEIKSALAQDASRSQKGTE